VDLLHNVTVSSWVLCRDVGVTQRHLDAAQVGAMSEQVPGEGMPQDVRRNLARIKARVDRGCGRQP
jgi:hypothetical protein